MCERGEKHKEHINDNQQELIWSYLLFSNPLVWFFKVGKQQQVDHCS